MVDQTAICFGVSVENILLIQKYKDKFSPQFHQYQKDHQARVVAFKQNEAFLELKCTTWSKNSFGLFNYHNANTENDMVKTAIFVTGQDTKLLRHEKHVEIDHASLRSRSKPRRIVVQVTA